RTAFRSPRAPEPIELPSRPYEPPPATTLDIANDGPLRATDRCEDGERGVLAQTFRPQRTIIEDVQLYLGAAARLPAPGVTLKVRLRMELPGRGAGAVLGTATATVDRLRQDGEWVTFDFARGVPVIPHRLYRLELEIPPSAYNL